MSESNLHVVLNTFSFKSLQLCTILSLHVDDLLKLFYTCSDIYEEFCNGNFAVSKSANLFFSIAINQPHEQNNGVGSAVRLLSQDRDAGLWRLEIAGPEVVWLLNNVKNFIILVLK